MVSANAAIAPEKISQNVNDIAAHLLFYLKES
jgi:hypothetical protein